MGVLDEIMQMKNQGMDENSIANTLRGKYSPREITDALAQSKIKSAVSNNLDDMNPPNPQTYSEGPQTQEINYQPQQEIYSPSGEQEYSPQQEQYPMQTGDYAYAPTSGAENMIEVAEQVAEQKMREIKKQINNLNEFRTIAQTRIEINTEKLKRIESTLDKLQLAILDKVGSYQNTLNSIKDEMSMMQDTFSKVAKGKIKKK